MVGVVFAHSGWGKLNDLPRMTQYFRDWGIPAPEFFTPLTAGIEFFGGLLLLVGLLTRFAAVPLMITMVVAIISAKLGDIHNSLVTFLGFEEVAYFVMFAFTVPVLAMLRRAGGTQVQTAESRNSAPPVSGGAP